MPYKLYSGVYKITNSVSNKCYVGSTNCIERRWLHHKKALLNNKHHSLKLQRSVNKHGIDNFVFEILEDNIEGKELLLEREQYYLDTLKPEYDILKLARSRLGCKCSEETKQKLRERNFKDKEKYDFLVKSMADLHRRIPLTEEHRKKLSEAGKKRIRVNESMPTSQREKLSVSTKKRFSGDKLESHLNAKFTWEIVRQIREEYTKDISMLVLAKKYNVQRGAIWKVLNNYSWVEKEQL